MTAPPARGLLDTSVLSAHESGRSLRADRLPAEAAMSVVTLAEPEAGVLAARDTSVRARRDATLEAVGDLEALPIDGAVAAAWGPPTCACGSSR